MSKDKKLILSILVENYSGTLSKVSGLFTRRGYNIDSLNVAETQDPNISRITVAVTGDSYIIEQITKQLHKLINVIKINILTENTSVQFELMMIKVNSVGAKRSEIIQIVDIFDANIVDVSSKNMIIVVTGSEDKNNSFLHLLTPYGIVEMTRTGPTALERG
ncbi:acetolactate synthase-1/3 small subunit [Sedimentibacter acidaminivorans]|jgi:acetolactate synthase I/III small subunit|uniref:Acetolactate synthase small subunit n=1 Tax=Sedimentibacter acidaminivorans TaxID=913099 RepID=A0ABS4GG32_9FIRM|nr:acetolactate synthase small subunit [Sedimentibacter acidaminivorans]MBP1926654.1 acetolactate synthase-1/3 small subunit [Sedimentibacter acidaminivorans]